MRKSTIRTRIITPLSFWDARGLPPPRNSPRRGNTVDFIRMLHRQGRTPLQRRHRGDLPAGQPAVVRSACRRPGRPWRREGSFLCGCADDPPGWRGKTSLGELRQLAGRANRQVLSLQTKSCRMKTTVVVLIVEGARWQWAYAGDSRLYHFVEGNLLWQTKGPQFFPNRGAAGADSPRADSVPRGPQPHLPRLGPR